MPQFYIQWANEANQKQNIGDAYVSLAKKKKLQIFWLFTFVYLIAGKLGPDWPSKLENSREN